MAVCVVKDMYKYKQRPYFEPLTKTGRKLIQRMLRHYVKQQLNEVIK